jgi:hypothetical protein
MKRFGDAVPPMAVSRSIKQLRLQPEDAILMGT